MQRSDFEGEVRRGRYIGPGIGLLKNMGVPATYATAGNVTYTAADIVGGIITRDCAGASRTDVTPTAAQLVAAIPGVRIGDIVACYLTNTSDAAETITLSGGTSVTFDANATEKIIARDAAKILFFRFTAVASGSEAAVCYF